MRRTPRAGRYLTLALISLFIAGCGGGLDVDLETVTGKVTLDSKPLEGADIEFQPTAPGGSPSSGVTDANGEYELMFTASEEGAMPGEHVVRISIFKPVEGGGADEEEGEEIQFSERKATVESGRNEINFDLKSSEAISPE